MERNAAENREWLELNKPTTKKRGKGSRYFRQRHKRLLLSIAQWEKEASRSNPPMLQCKRLISLFGGIVPFSVVIGVHPTSILVWLGVREEKGKYRPTGGLVPTELLPRVVEAARGFGIILKAEDLFPDIINVRGDIDLREEIKTWAKKLDKSIKMRELEDFIAQWASIPA